MSVFLVSPQTVIEVDDHRSLLAAWRTFSKDFLAQQLIGRFIVRKPLTEGQIRRLPKQLREKIECSGDGAVDWLRNLWELPDTRG